MSSELERRLERALGEAPGPDPGITDRALRAALEALPSPAEARLARRRRLVLLLAACLAAFVSGGVTLAATGAHLPVVNPEPESRKVRNGPPPSAVSHLPAGTSIWAVARGRVVVVTNQTPIRMLHDPRVRAFSASPGSLYAVEGRGRTLRALEIHGQRVVWSRRDLGGRPVAAVWSPFPIRIAYLLRTARGYTVGDIWGTGTHPFTVDRAAARVTPTWRWDSKALAYVTASGVVVVHDVIGGTNRPLAQACGIRRPVAVAFAPVGAVVAVADRAGRVALLNSDGRDAARCLDGPAGRPHVAWLGSKGLVVAAGSSLTRFTFSGPETASRTVAASLPIVGLDASPDHRRIVVLLRGRTGTTLAVTTAPRLHSEGSTLPAGATLIHLRGLSHVQWR